MTKQNKPLKGDEIIRQENKKLKERREKLTGQKVSSDQLKKTKFGIALSGGGIRSATINLGFLKTLNQFGILEKADYLSTVSGGGYTGAYIQAGLKNEKSFDKLFSEEHIKYKRSRGTYMIPGQGWWKSWSTLVLTIGFAVSLVMSWVSPFIIFLMLYAVYLIIGKIFNLNELDVLHTFLGDFGLVEICLYTFGAIFILHFISNLILKYNVGVSRKFNHAEAILAGFGIIWFSAYLITSLRSIDKHNYGDGSILYYLMFIGIIFILGFFANPNALSFHRFYRNQLADAFLHLTGRFKNIRIKDLFDTTSSEKGDYLAPYPLINTCLNLQSTSDPKFKGAKANDYYLLSPLYCGAKLTGYVPTKYTPDYSELTLPAATTISAAAVNPGMGMYSNKLLSVIMTLFNARLGFWIFNPTKINNSNIVWWPTYFFYELFSKIGTNNRKLNISDGGHIENLGVYELLRRKCRLIISVDAGADPTYSFSDLENLAIRARNELGLEISFPRGKRPEDIIRPKPSNGYSEQRYAIGGVYQLWEEIIPEDENGDPICGKDGKPIEVLVNYKNVRDVLSILNESEQMQLNYALDRLDISKYYEEVLERIKDPEEIQNIYEDFGMNDNLQNVFQALLTVFNEIKSVLEFQLEYKLEDRSEEKRVMRKVIEVIDEKAKNALKVSTFVYVKSSVVAPQRKLKLTNRDSLSYQTYKYKVYHPSFPHEPTSDQFFDEVQWESYFRLGQFIGSDVLGVDNLNKYFNKVEDSPSFKFNELISHFDEGTTLFKKPIIISAEPVMRDRGSIVIKDPNDPSKEIMVPVSEKGETEAASTEAIDPSKEKINKIVVGGEDNYTM